MLEEPTYLLMADDSDPDVELFRIAAKKAGITATIFTVKDGEDLIKFLKKDPPFEKVLEPDLVLLDIAMPSMDGIEALKQIKNTPSLTHIPILMFTNSNRDEDVRTCYENHANSYIVKPFEGSDYNKVVELINLYWLSVAKLPKKRTKKITISMGHVVLQKKIETLAFKC